MTEEVQWLTVGIGKVDEVGQVVAEADGHGTAESVKVCRRRRRNGRDTCRRAGQGRGWRGRYKN